ncbi:MAG: hypothetical protein ABI839_07260, partial [Verrucomicrobiota bacterium]
GQLGLNLVRGKSHPRSVEYWVWGSGLVFSAVILITLGRISLRLLREVEEPEKVVGGVDIQVPPIKEFNQPVWAQK